MRRCEAIGSVLALLLTLTSVNAYRSNGGAVLLAESETELDPNGVSPATLAAAGCPNACSDNGYCLESTCVCFEGFAGKDCLKRQCVNGCNGHGVCEDGVCNCHVGWAGPDCGFQACVDDCNNGGFCRFEPRKPATCVCQPGRSGHACEKFDNGAEASQPCGLDNLCSNNGVCRNAQCACFSSFTGHDCSLMLCPDSCHGRGECNVNTGVCRCNEPFQPPNCALARCPGDCNGNGDCDKSNGKCTCKPGFYPPDCAQTNCKDNCHGNGKCIPVNSEAKQWKCDCFEGWLNDTCGHEKPCLHGCSGHGMCDRGTCYCTAGWRGADCSKSSELAAGDASSSHSHRGCDPPCAATGVCLEHKTGWRCFCREGWTGLSCANADHGTNLHGFKLGSNPGKDEQGEGEAAKS